ncbi:MAG: SGNH/GDSL hydrolase family protein [Bacteroidetes bacterium]|nr:MAG: SGNH/GDSL hydrolase family protein [Bacteroidota bacterium]
MPAIPFFCLKLLTSMSPEKAPISPARQRLFRLIAVLFGLFLIFVVGELFLRVFPGPVSDPPAPPPYNYRVPDETYGWLVQEGYQYTGTLHDQCDTVYPINISFGSSGFRTWGDPDVTRRLKVLFLGDSYTACAQTSDDRLFYKLLGDSLPIEVFAYGAAGYSNAQQLLVLEKYFDAVQPDLVVWQMCSNDFIDNYWELEEIANYHVRMKRPYILEDGSVVHKLAAEYPRNVKPYSHFLYFILKRIAEARGTFDRPPPEPAEKFIAEQNLAYAPFARSVRMTDMTYKKMKALLPAETKLLVFDADGFQPQFDQFARLCRENQIEFAGGPADLLNHFRSQGDCVHTDDGYHWNDRGNALVAAFLKPHVQRILGIANEQE